MLVATDVASRGIHVQDIAHVINYDLPEMAENFIHRVGRTGRAGELGVASTLFSREQRTELFQLERTLGITDREDAGRLESCHRMRKKPGPNESMPSIGQEPGGSAAGRISAGADGNLTPERI